MSEKYVREMNAAELRAHMRRLQAMPGWHDPLSDSLYAEIQRMDGARAALAQPPQGEAEDLADAVSKAMRRAWSLGQTYWQQADSEYVSQYKKCDETQARFEALVDETRAAVLAATPSASPDPKLVRGVLDDLERKGLSASPAVCKFCHNVENVGQLPPPQYQAGWDDAMAEKASASAAALTACKGTNCGCTDGKSHSLECQAEHAVAIAGGRFVK